MAKIKIYGAFLALIYSLLLYTAQERNPSPAPGGSYETGQIRNIEKRSNDYIITTIRGSGTIQSLPSRGHGALGGQRPVLSCLHRIKTPRAFRRVFKPILYRSIATERFRVLRN